MADQRRPILFEPTMTANKRAASAAYLRKNILDTPTEGLYPATDFIRTNPELTNEDTPAYIFGDSNRTWVLVARYSGGTDTIRFYGLGSNSTSNPTYTGYMRAATLGGDGIYFVDWDTDDVMGIGGSGSAGFEGHFNISPAIDIGGWDGLQYWWVGRDIWRQIPREDPVLMMDYGVPSGVQFMDFYGDEMVIFVQQGGDVMVLFYDKSNSALFNRRVTIRNANILAGGVVEGRLMIVYAVGNVSNLKEEAGEMIVGAWNGQEFVEINSLTTGLNIRRPSVSYAGTTCATGSRIMVFAVDYSNPQSNQPDLHQRYIYELKRDGSISVVDLPVNGRRAEVVGITFDAIAYANNVDEIYSNIPALASAAQRRRFDRYEDFTSTEYITNFLTNPDNYKTLLGVSITFEKLFKNTAGTGGGEQVDIYCRVSDREDWTLLGEVTAQKVIDNVDTRRSIAEKEADVPVNMQRYQITKLPDGTALPEFNEIQFKFVLKNGMSLTGAWFEYDYITRNTKR